MVTCEKEILVPGRVFDPKTRQWYEFTARDVRDGARNLTAMSKRGRKPPIFWEHQSADVTDPDEWLAQFARNTIGFMGAGRVSTAADVRKGVASKPGTLLAVHHIYDPRDAEQLKRLDVSPKLLNGYRDSDGAKYPGVVPVHSAATPLACQFNKAPFRFDIALSDTTQLLVAYRKPAPRGKPCPPDNSRRRGVALSTTNPERDMADEKEDKEPKGEGDEGAEGGKNAELKDLIEALRSHGMNIPDEVEDLKHLIIAVKANASGTGTEPDGDENPDDDLDAAGAASGADATAPAGGSPPMLMSTTDPGEKGKRARAEVRADRADACRLVDQALQEGKCHGIEARKLRRVFAGCELSVTTAGDVTGARWDAALATLNEIRKRPRNWALTNGVELSAADTVPGPEQPPALRGEDKPVSPDVLSRQEELARRYSRVTK